MSLLLEALKKAEKAKEEAQRRAASDPGSGELRLEPTLSAKADPNVGTHAEPRPEAKAVLTRAELPDIKQPLEILSEDIAAKPQAAAARPVPRSAEPHAAERATARKVFEAKLREPNPRLPFYIALGFLGAFALGTVGYFWYQLRPPPALVNAKPPAGGNTVAAELAQAKPAEPQAAAPARNAIPGLPSAAAAPIALPAPAPAKAAASAPTPKPTAVPERAPTPRTSRAEAASRPRSVRQDATRLAAPVAAAAPAPSRPLQIDPKVESAYAAYLAGDLAAARIDYREALRTDGGNRDALLGLAAVELRGGRHESAEAAYLRLLQLDPNDSHAQAGLIALRTGRLDPIATESRLKSMIATDPGANVLHFTLGNQLARQGRWAEAQQEYFKAFAATPGNGDFAYNLAVSLDHLRQPKLALEYYQRAITLAEMGGASFDVAAARARAAQLAGL